MRSDEGDPVTIGLRYSTARMAVVLLVAGAVLSPLAAQPGESSEGVDRPGPRQEIWCSLWEGDGVSPPSTEGWWVREYGGASITTGVSGGATVVIVDDPDSFEGAWMQRYVDFEPPFTLSVRGRYDPLTGSSGFLTMAEVFTGVHRMGVHLNPTTFRIGGVPPVTFPAVQGTWYNVTLDVKAPLDVDVYSNGALMGNAEMVPADSVVWDQTLNKPLITAVSAWRSSTSVAMVDYIRTTMCPLVIDAPPKVPDRTPPRILNVSLDDGVQTPSDNLTIPWNMTSTTWLNATIDDTVTGNSSIWSANYTLGAANWPGTPMSPSDGAFDTAVENVSALVDVSGLPEGNYTYCVYGRDYNGSWNSTGACATLDLVYQAGGAQTDPISPYWWNGPAPVTATAAGGSNPVASVDLWYRYSVDNVSWGGWTYWSADASSPWAWSIPFPDGEGYYEFAATANDTAGVLEAAPTSPEAEAAYDITPPATSVQPLAPYWRVAPSIDLTATAADGLSGVSEVLFYARFSTDNASWTPWALSSTDDTQPYVTTYIAGQGDGYYEFRSEATDLAGNTFGDNLPDAAVGLDMGSPDSAVTQPTPYWRNAATLSLAGQASDVTSGLEQVTLFHRYSVDNATWGSWGLWDVDAGQPWSWIYDASLGDGYYEFYSAAQDVAGNVESPPPTADALAGLDTAPPVSSLDPLVDYWWASSPVQVTAQASDALSGVGSVLLLSRWSLDNASFTAWSTAGVSQAPPWTFSFDAPQGDGFYQLGTVSQDNAGNWEADGGPEILLAVDRSPPNTRALSISPYVQTAPPVVVQAEGQDLLSGLAGIELMYRHSPDNASWSSWQSAGERTGVPFDWSFSASDGEGYYEFMTTGRDALGNLEGAPFEADSRMVYSVSGGPVDLENPSITYFLPADGATAVPPSTMLVVGFSEPMNRTSVESAVSLTAPGGAVQGVFAWIDPSVVTFTPSNPLEPGVLYTASVAGSGRDLAGNLLDAGAAWMFATQAVEREVRVILFWPQDDATDVPLDVRVLVGFSEAMNQATAENAFSLEGAGGTVPGTFAWSDDGTVLTFSPAATLEPNTSYGAGVTTLAENLAGDSMGASVVWSFTTVPQDQVQEPAGTTPQNWKPLMALAFALILQVVAGAMIARAAPEGERSSRIRNLAVVGILFSVVEFGTGAASMVLPLLAVPPILGVGTAVDAAILAAGLVVLVVVGMREAQGAVSPSAKSNAPPPND